MTIGTTQPRATFNCDGVSTVFPVPIQAYLATDFTVILTAPVSAGGGSTTLTLNSDYSLTTSSTDQPPKWTLTTIGSSSPRPANYTLQVFINPVQQQQTQYVQGQAFPSLAIQTNMDRLTQMVQRLQDELGRSIRVPDGDVSPAMLLPPTASRILQYLGFDANGNAIAVPSLPGSAITQSGLGAVLYPVLGTEVGVVNLWYPYGNALRHGADPTGLTDSTTVIQNAATSVTAKGGGVLYFPVGTYMINRSILIGSGTTLRGDGPKATTIKANPTYVGVGGTSYATETSPFIQNVNFAAAALTDTDIAVENIGFNWGSVTITGGGAHSISLRFVDRVRVNNVFSQNGENVTALLNCRDTKTYFSEGLNCSNAYFDHWDGTQGGEVIGCTGRTLTGTTNQGIQFTGQGSFGDGAATQNCVVAFCQLYGIHGTLNQSSAIIANANGSASTIARMLSFGNHIEASDNGLVYQGAVGRCKSIGDYFKGVTALPIFFNSDASGTPSDCRVIDPTLEDCNHLAGNIALISIQGTNNRVEGVKVFSPSGVLYVLIGYIVAAATNCYLHIEVAPNGTGGSRVQMSSVTSLIKDIADLDAQAYPIPTIASAATIAPVNPIVNVSGVVAISNITAPPGVKNWGGQITLIPTGAFTTTATGNIVLASAAVVGKALIMTFNPAAGASGLWYPSY